MRHEKGQIAGLDLGALRGHHGALDDVPKLADIARPIMILEDADGFGREPRRAQTAELGGELLSQERDIGPTIAKRRQLDVGRSQMLEEILIEAPFTHHRGEWMCRRRNESGREIDLALAADAGERPPGQRGEQLDLHGVTDAGDLVDQDGSASGLLEGSGLRGADR